MTTTRVAEPHPTLTSVSAKSRIIIALNRPGFLGGANP